MFRICLNLSRYNLTKIEGCLKVLKLDYPTTKKEIKARYFQLAKQLHPDVKDEKGLNTSAQNYKKRSEQFIEITKAYKYLSELQEKQINNPKADTAENDPYFSQDQNSELKKQGQRPMTQQEKTRRETYAYFNKKYRKQSYEDESRKKQPLYKQIPEFFIGCFFVAAFFVEWALTAARRSSKNIQKQKTEDLSDVIEGFSFKKRYQKNLQ